MPQPAGTSVFMHRLECWTYFFNFFIYCIECLLIFITYTVCLSYNLVFYPPCSFFSRVALCKTPGCFLQSLSNPGTTYGRNFKQNKEELTSKLYRLYNTSVFDSKVINVCFPCSILNFLEIPFLMYKCWTLFTYFVNS